MYIKYFRTVSYAKKILQKRAAVTVLYGLLSMNTYFKNKHFLRKHLRGGGCVVLVGRRGISVVGGGIPIDCESLLALEEINILLLWDPGLLAQNSSFFQRTLGHTGLLTITWDQGSPAIRTRLSSSLVLTCCADKHCCGSFVVSDAGTVVYF